MLEEAGGLQLDGQGAGCGAGGGGGFGVADYVQDVGADPERLGTVEGFARIEGKRVVGRAHGLIDQSGLQAEVCLPGQVHGPGDADRGCVHTIEAVCDQRESLLVIAQPRQGTAEGDTGDAGELREAELVREGDRVLREGSAGLELLDQGEVDGRHVVGIGLVERMVVAVRDRLGMADAVVGGGIIAEQPGDARGVAEGLGDDAGALLEGGMLEMGEAALEPALGGDQLADAVGRGHEHHMRVGEPVGLVVLKRQATVFVRQIERGGQVSAARGGGPGAPDLDELLLSIPLPYGQFAGAGGDRDGALGRVAVGDAGEFGEDADQAEFRRLARGLA